MIRGGILGIFIVVCWMIVLVDYLIPKEDSLVYLGIIPRTMLGLRGLLFAPFIHSGIGHVATNTLGIVIMGGLLMMDSLKTFFVVTAWSWFVGGFFTWLIGPAHMSIIGAGYLVYGWLGYVLANPFFQRPFSFKALGLAALAGVIYSGLIFGLFPKDTDVVWESSFAGFLAGILGAVAYWFIYLRWYKPKFGAASTKSEKVPLIQNDGNPVTDPAYVPPAYESNSTPNWAQPSPAQNQPQPQSQPHPSQPTWLSQTSQPNPPRNKPPAQQDQTQNPSQPPWLAQTSQPNTRKQSPQNPSQPEWLTQPEEQRSSVNINKGNFTKENPFLFQQEQKQNIPPKPSNPDVDEIFSNPFVANDDLDTSRKDVKYGDNPFA